MDQQFQGKSIPWLQLKTYFEIHKRFLNIEEMMKTGDMTLSEAGTKLPKPVFQIHEELTKVLKEHNILKEREDNKLSQL
jgi:hypothetical protein